jgi:MFS family permease
MSTYRELVRETGPAFLVLAFLARLPAAMVPLGVITLVASATGSFATAGATAAAFGVGCAVGGPFVGGLADRFGQRPAGLFASLINAFALAAFAIGVLAGQSSLVITVLAAVAGLSTPQVGPLVRVRWVALLSKRKLNTAFSYEGAADELSYMAGPALVGIIALLGGAWLPLLIAAGLTLLAAVPFALHHTAVPAVSRTRVAVALPMAPLALLIVAMAGIGVIFGAAQTGVTAFAEESGIPSAAGLIYAALGVGSAVAGLATAWLPARWNSLTRYTGSAIALVLGCVALAFAPSTLAGVMLAMLAVGVVSAPYLIAIYALASDIIPATRAGAAMTLLGSGVVAGVALGAAVAGRLADTFGHAGAFAVPLVAAVISLGTAAIFRLTAARRPTLTPA